MRTFDADRYLEEGKTFTLGGRIFEVPIVPSIVTGIIAKNAKAYERFVKGEMEEGDFEVALKIIAAVLNQRLDVNDRVTSDWVGNHLDVRSTRDAINYLTGADEPEKKSPEDEAEEGKSDSMRSSTESSVTTDDSPHLSSTA